MFVRAGRNEVGGACFIATRRKCVRKRKEKPLATSRRLLEITKITGQELKCREFVIEVREIYYESSVDVNQKSLLREALKLTAAGKQEATDRTGAAPNSDDRIAGLPRLPFSVKRVAFTNDALANLQTEFHRA